jgi:competence protein ComEC
MRIAFLLLLALFSWRYYHRFLNPNLRITFYDVGQGDAALVQFPYGKNWLIDSGGGNFRWDMGSRVLFPELTRLGILTIDAAILSHPDKDHSQGFTSLLKELTVKELWYNAVFHDHKKLSQLRSDDKNQQTKFLPISKPKSHLENGVRVSLFPLRSKIVRETNNQTLLLHLSFSGCSILFMGDTEHEGEFSALPWLTSPVSLLKVAHHGSKTSSTEIFLKKVRPRVGIISVGNPNYYGHPHPRILTRFQKRRIPVLRTDFHGYVQFTITPKGEAICNSALGPCGIINCQRSQHF